MLAKDAEFSSQLVLQIVIEKNLHGALPDAVRMSECDEPPNVGRGQ